MGLLFDSNADELSANRHNLLLMQADVVSVCTCCGAVHLSGTLMLDIHPLEDCLNCGGVLEVVA